MRTFNFSHHQQGFTLIELMISMTIGLMLVGAMLMAFVASARTYKAQDAMAEVQENGRFAMSLLLKDLRQSGVDQTGGPYIEGIINSVDDVKNFETKYSDLVISQSGVKSEIVYLPGLGSDGLAYYIGETSSGRISLYRNKDAVVEGVEQLVMEYGVDSDNDQLVDQYKPISDITASEWSDVVSARFNLLVSSSGTATVDHKQTLSSPFNGVDTSDRRLYQAYTATALLRNAVL